MESNIYSAELEAMREQIQILKNKLDNEKIINDRILKKAMNKSLNKLQRQGVASIIKGVIALITCPLIIYFIGLPLWLSILTAIMIIFSTVCTAIIHSGINSDLLYREDMIIVAQKVRKLKKDYKNWLYIGIPMIILYLAIFVHGIMQSELIPQEAHIPMYIGVLVGGIIGGIIGVMEHFRLQQTSNELLEQIREISQ